MKYTPEYLEELKFIVEFMGGSIFNITSETSTEKNLYGPEYWKCSFTPENKRSWITPSGLFYKKKWEWLFPVILQICSRKQYHFSIKHVKYEDLWVARIHNAAKDFTDVDGSKTPLESAYKVVTMFFKWLENIVDLQTDKKKTETLNYSEWQERKSK